MTDATSPAPSPPAEDKLELLPCTFACKGRDWTVRFTDSLIKAVQDVAKVDLWNSIDIQNSPLVLLGRDERLLRDAVWVLVKEQVDREQISKADFYDDFNGQVFDDAFIALQGGLERFFSAHRRAALRQAICYLETLGKTDVANQKEAFHQGLAAIAETTKEAIAVGIQTSKTEIRSTMLKTVDNVVKDALRSASNDASTSSSAAATSESRPIT